MAELTLEQLKTIDLPITYAVVPIADIRGLLDIVRTLATENELLLARLAVYEPGTEPQPVE